MEGEMKITFLESAIFDSRLFLECYRNYQVDELRMKMDICVCNTE